MRENMNDKRTEHNEFTIDGQVVPYPETHDIYWEPWIDAFKALLVRFETKSHTWMGLHYLAFSLILIRNQTNHF